MEELIVSTKAFFDLRHIHLSNDWLESCIEWIYSEHHDQAMDESTLHSEVYQQWICLDLAVVQISVLPSNLTAQLKVVLKDTYCLQMTQVIDISRSKMSQLNTIRGTASCSKNDQDYEKVEMTETGKRMLQLTLTDGVQTIQAVEYKSVACLSSNLQPGVKVKIIGPVTMRRGRIMLEPRNIEIIGGQVDDLVITNALENVLARALHKPENPNPGGIKEETQVAAGNNAAPTNASNRQQDIFEVATNCEPMAMQSSSTIDAVSNGNQRQPSISTNSGGNSGVFMASSNTSNVARKNVGQKQQSILSYGNRASTSTAYNQMQSHVATTSRMYSNVSFRLFYILLLNLEKLLCTEN